MDFLSKGLGDESMIKELGNRESGLPVRFSDFKFNVIFDLPSLSLFKTRFNFY